MSLNISLASSVASTTGSTQTQRTEHRPRELDALASKLGVDVDTLDQAFKSAMQNQKSSGDKPDKTALDTAVAKSLNIDVSTLQSAMKEVGFGQGGPGGKGGPGGPPPGGPPPDAGASMQQVADQLGVSSDDLESAFKTALEMMKAGQSASSTSSTSKTSASSATSATSASESSVEQLFANVAEQLGVETTDLMDAMRQAGGRRVDQRV